VRCNTREKKELRQAPLAVYLWAVVLSSSTTAWALQDQYPAAPPKLAILPFECVEGCTDETVLGLGLATEVTHWPFYLPGASSFDQWTPSHTGEAFTMTWSD
jgi:hypothetical protein